MRFRCKKLENIRNVEFNWHFCGQNIHNFTVSSITDGRWQHSDISAILKPANPSHYDFVKVMKLNLIDFDVINQTERMSGTLKSRTYGGDGRLVHSEITILLNDRVFLFETGQILWFFSRLTEITTSAQIPKRSFFKDPWSDHGC